MKELGVTDYGCVHKKWLISDAPRRLERRGVAEVMLQQFPADHYPYLAEKITEVTSKSGWQYADEFGLDLILEAPRQAPSNNSLAFCW